MVLRILGAPAPVSRAIVSSDCVCAASVALVIHPTTLLVVFLSRCLFQFLDGWLFAGIAATILSSLLVTYVFIPPQYSFAVTENRYFLSIGIFLLMGVLFSVFHDRLKKTHRGMNAALMTAESIRTELENKVAERTNELAKSNALFLKSEERLRLLISGVEGYAIFTKDLQGVVTSWNPGAERMYGYTSEEIVGHPVPILAAPGKERDFAEVLEKAGRGEAIRRYETQRRAKSGKILDVSLSISPLQDSSGTIVEYSSIGRDITEHRRAEEALRKSESRYKALFESNTSAVYLSTQDGRFLDCNDAMVGMFGYPSKAEFLSVTADQLYESPDERNKFI